MARRRSPRRRGGFRRAFGRRFSGSARVNFQSAALGGGLMALGEPLLDQTLDSVVGDNLLGDAAKVFSGAWLSGSRMPSVKVAGIALAVIGARDGVRRLLPGGLGSINLGGLLGGTTPTATMHDTSSTVGGLYA